MIISKNYFSTRTILLCASTLMISCSGLQAMHEQKKKTKTVLASKLLMSLVGTGLFGYHTYLQYTQCSGNAATTPECFDSNARVATSAFFTVLSSISVLRLVHKQACKQTESTSK